MPRGDDEAFIKFFDNSVWMKEEDLIHDAQEALHELEQKRSRKGEKEKLVGSGPERKNPFAYLLVLVLLLLIILMAVPYYGVKLDPMPKNIPSPEEVMPYHIRILANETATREIQSRNDILKLMVPDHQAIRNMAVKISTSACRESEICYSKALFFFVRDNFQYIHDPPNEYYESPFETLYSGGADCDGLAILLANLQAGAGIPTRFAFIPGHVYVQVKIDNAPKRYRDKDDWISLDPTCDSCDFGEIPYNTFNKKKEFLYI
jgi:hypothetical protein